MSHSVIHMIHTYSKQTMSAAKHNSTMDKATGLILPCLTLLCPKMCLFVNRSTYNTCIMAVIQCMHHGLAFALLCVPVLFADNARCQFAIAQCGFLWLCWLLCLSPVFSVATGLIARLLLVLFFVCNTL